MDEKKLVELCGWLVSEQVFEAVSKDWPVRPPTGFDDRSWAAACSSHVQMVARQHGEDPEPAPQASPPRRRPRP